MKKINIIFLLIFVSSYSQVLPLQNYGDNLIDSPNIYWEDVDGILDPFVGDWIYSQNGIVFKIKFIKSENKYSDNCYQDLLVGEYYYALNNQILINKLDDVNIELENQFHHNISCNFIISDPNYWKKCLDCMPGEYRIMGGFTDVVSNYVGTCILKKTTLNNQEAIKIYISYLGNAVNKTIFSIPPTISEGWYTFIKQ
jgi:hypothetical protein